VATRPVSSPRTKRAGTVSRPVRARAAVAKAIAAIAICPRPAVSRRGHRSTRAPPPMPSSRPGRACTDSDTPVIATEPVSRRMSRFWAIICIQAPALLIRLANTHHRRLGVRRARQGPSAEPVPTGLEGTDERRRRTR
jgi:hypothetical protein